MVDIASAAVGNLDAIKVDKKPATLETQRKTIADDFDTFLLLLTTQLKNQDPTEPLDTNQFTQQLVAFSGVEQAIATNKNLEKLIELSGGKEINSAVNFIGKQVNAQGDQSMLTDGLAEFVYELPVGVTNAQITITDASGQAVFSGNGSAKADGNVVIWDGVNSFNGTNSPDGVYKITVIAKNSKGERIEQGVKTFTTGRVTGVEAKDEGVELTLGAIKVMLDDVVAVREPLTIEPPPAQAASDEEENT